MFERYTERARRTLFFARYEASNYGQLTIETEHLLLGLVREGKGYTSRILQPAGLTLDATRREVDRRRPKTGAQVSTSIEIPFSDGIKRALTRAAVEADSLEHAYIGAEHLLLGLLHDTTSGAGEVLAAYGLNHDAVRKQIVEMLNEGVSAGSDQHPQTGPELVAAIEAIKQDIVRLASLAATSPPPQSPAFVELTELNIRIHEALDRLKPPHTT
jgi:ATP-dependent Clp protease ATP-binding subunit ClpC